MWPQRSKIATGVLLVLVALPGQGAEPGNDVHRLLGDGEVVKALALLRERPDRVNEVDWNQQTPLHVAAHRGRPEAVKWLLAHGAKVNAVAYNGFTPLHLTTDGQIATLLIRAGGDLDRVDNWGNTPLQKAAEHDLKDVVEAILATGHPIDLRSAVVLGKRDLVKKMLRENPAVARTRSRVRGLGGSATPLGYAAGEGDRELVELLLDAGADVNEATWMPNAGGDATALANAVWGGHTDVVALLLRRGARTAHVTGGKFYPTILDYARKHSKPEIVALLENASAGKDEPDPDGSGEVPAGREKGMPGGPLIWWGLAAVVGLLILLTLSRKAAARAVPGSRSDVAMP